ncbi:hypothetical protein [Thermoactinomyces mirandus]|uniref:Uncharacterized protein n=1 Tax=Thermoactinomyces mirandus TaxID=2756294 RepID=A0A7W1XQA2_9BACL|nr:hypothetical protein [Thermoactinomyces mirandus]MBA4601288.1 hypothetical protein [Thermoactinomyces mirandus]
MVIRSSLQLYKQEFGRILLLGLLVTLPVQLIAMFFTNYFYTYYGILNLVYVADWFFAFIILLSISFVQIPFIRLFQLHISREPVKVSKTIDSLMKSGFTVYVMGILYAICVVVSSLFFIIPGLILMVLLYAFPYAVVMEGEKWGSAFKLAIQFGKDNFFRLLGIILGFSLVEMTVERIIEFGVLSLTHNFLIISLVLLTVNMFFIPLFSFINGFVYAKWAGQLD